MRIWGGHDGGSGCGYYRMIVPLAELGRHEGFEVTFRDAGDANGPSTVTARDLDGYDVVAGQRFNSHTGLQVWRGARKPGNRLVYELDDDVWNVTPENWAAYHLYRRPDVLDAIEHSVQVSDLVTTTTPVLADVFRAHGATRVAVLPNCVPAWTLDLPRQHRDRPRVGWMGGASHGADITIIADPVRRFLKRFPGWDVALHGTDYRPTFKVRADRAFYVPWVKVFDEPRAYFTSIDFDVGLAPLWPTEFARSKSAIKVIEYGARGIPAIASDCDAYRDVIEHGVNGFLVKDDHQWLRYLSDLAADEALRAKMGEAAREMARGHLIEDHWHLWAGAYRSLFRSRPVS